MRFSKKINTLRRKLMRGISSNIGKRKNNNPAKIMQPQVTHILLIRPNNRLGNLLMISPLMQELIQNFPHCKIDLFVRGGLSPILFKNYAQVERIIPLPKKPFKALIKYLKVWGRLRQKKYDLVFNIDSHSSSGRIATQLARTNYKFFGDENEDKLGAYPDARHMAKRPVYLLRENLNLPITQSLTAPIPSLSIKPDAAELEKGKTILNSFFDQPRPVITLFTYATGPKCYSTEWWADLFTALSTRFPEYHFLEVLPAEKISQLQHCIPGYHSMDVREICSVIAASTLFIGSDSGIMHLGAAAGIPSIGLFSVTDVAMYQPYNNGSLGINTNEMNTEQIMDVVSSLLGQAKQ